jgi:hypothetical protein
MRKTALIVALLLSVLAPASACDVSLFAIVAGNSPNNAFAEKLTRVVGFAKAVAHFSMNKEKLPGHLQKLMVAWIDFSNTFLINPPEWSKGNPDWKPKFDELADLIGSVRKNLASPQPDQPKAHRDIQKFTRRLSRLYDGLKMNEIARLQLDITRHIDDAWDACWEKEQQKLIEATARFTEDSRLLSEKLVGDAAKLAANIAQSAEKLQKMAAKDDVFAGKSFEFMLNMTENDYADLNDSRLENKTTDSKPQK